jgi:hypothetical protein
MTLLQKQKAIYAELLKRKIPPALAELMAARCNECSITPDVNEPIHQWMYDEIDSFNWVHTPEGFGFWESLEEEIWVRGL